MSSTTTTTTIHSRRIPSISPNYNQQQKKKQSIIPDSPTLSDESKSLEEFFKIEDKNSLHLFEELTPPTSIPGSPNSHSPSSPLDYNYSINRFNNGINGEVKTGETTTTSIKLKRRNGIQSSSNNDGIITINSRDLNQIKLKQIQITDHDIQQNDLDLNSITSPILPKVKLSFPKIMSDEDEDEIPIWNGLSNNNSIKKRSTNLSGASLESIDTNPRSRTNSQTSTTTTTTTTTRKKTEHRSWRYSMPAFDPVTEQYVYNTPPHRSLSSTGSRYNSNSTPIRNSNNSQIPFPSTSSPSTTSVRKPATSFHNPTPRSTKTSLPIPMRETRRSSPLPPSSFSSTTSSTTSSKLPSNPFGSFFHRSPSNASSKVSSYHALPVEALNAFPLPPSSSSRPTPIRNSMRNASLPLVTPLLNMFMFFLVTSIACCSISAVLIAGFSLTFYDDCGRRVKLLRNGIEGVNFSNVSKLVGGAVGEWAKSATKRLKASGSVSRSGSNRRNNERFSHSDEFEGLVGEENGQFRNESPIPPPFESEEDITSHNNSGLKYKDYMRTGSNSRSRSRVRRKSSTSLPNNNISSSSMSKKLSNSSRFFPRLFGGSNSKGKESTNEWYSDEDNLPFEVPTSTPHPSRPNSPPPSSTNSTRPLPPRPPFTLLVPSIIFALIYTFLKVTFDYWRGNRRPRTTTSTAREL